MTDFAQAKYAHEHNMITCLTAEKQLIEEFFEIFNYYFKEICSVNARKTNNPKTSLDY